MPAKLKPIALALLLLVLTSFYASNNALQTIKRQTANENENATSKLTIQQRDKPKPIPTCMVFLHIPKSGGRSVISLITAVTLGVMSFTEQRTYGAENVNMKVSDLQVNHTITFGHFTTLLFEEEPKFRQCFTMTVLREPVDRAISAFFYHGHRKREINKCLHAATIKHREVSIKGRRHLRGVLLDQERIRNKKARSCRANWQYSNDMTRRLAGSSDTKWNTRAESKYRVVQPNKTHLEDAKKKLLDEFDLVCFIHDLPSCADRILDAFQLNRTDERLHDGLSYMTAEVDPRFKTINRPNELDEFAMDEFRRANVLDLELYDWALKLVPKK
ncbi:hypothetical protein ACHAWO_013571 [Cyclotella atomus]|uniref:Uncharacterized protein n=1 Tax=Cyclotella atomus TaxID=382360 RepID=A0ABD3N0M6_9STRA